MAGTGAISGYVLRLIRESTGRSQTAFGDAIGGVDLSTVQGWESGRRPVANMKAGTLIDLRHRLPLLGADKRLIGLLDAAMDADRIVAGILAPPAEATSHPLAQWVHDRMTTHMIAWTLIGRPPPIIAALPVPTRRGASPTAPTLSAPDRAAVFTNLRTAIESAPSTGAGVLLRRQALYLTSYDRSPGASSWTAQALHSRRGTLGMRGWSPQWAEARSTATALARLGDHTPLIDFIDRAIADDDRGEAANLTYWAYWFGAVRQAQPDDGFMGDVGELSSWEPMALLHRLVRGLDEAPTYNNLYAHSIWSLMTLHPWLPDAAPQAASVLSVRVAGLLDGAEVSTRARRELSAVHRQIGERNSA
ncbi:transcriptional regulator [Mangrovactinospora gilvigrisea]|uniref:Transcriptional regulator n=1 Tax=Mangrovactinospora gilvigrisea TaxID=1428644 RepID=A0A1J7CCH9_9ACTN|nr:helix-turn-helix transcriptional regulator [Mangrovactinospora gilvigrisea]OIV37386.1 transcriptional regulator [Mangrovactinospora gilvigrisea]